MKAENKIKYKGKHRHGNDSNEDNLGLTQEAGKVMVSRTGKNKTSELGIIFELQSKDT